MSRGAEDNKKILRVIEQVAEIAREAGLKILEIYNRKLKISGAKTMKAIILAAGRGSRMGNLTVDKPKGMVKLGGKMLLEWQINAIRKAGIGKIVIVRGYCGNAMLFSDIDYLDNKRWKTTNMVASLCEARGFLKKEDCVVSYADIVYTSNTVRSLMKKEGDIVITYDVNWYALWKARFADPLADAETFQVNNDGILLEIGNRTRSLDKINGQYMGLLKFTAHGWSLVQNYLDTLSQELVDRLDMTGMLRGLLGKSIKIHTVPITDPWFEVDSEEDLKLYEKRMNDG